MGYVWTPEQIDRYFTYYQDIRTHQTFTYAAYATTAEFARSVLPPCLEPADQPTVTVMFGAFMEWIGGVPNRAGRDRATLIGINARHGDDEGIYYLTVIEVEEVNIVTGRELWGMPKKQGNTEFFEDGEQVYAIADRKGYRLVELQANLGEPQPVDGTEESEIYFELRGYFGPNGRGLSGTQLLVFENRSVTKRFRPLTDVRLQLGESPVDPGVASITLGEFVEGGHLGGETSYLIRDVVDLDGDGQDYAPYLLGRLYDDWPDVRDVRGRVIGAAAARSR